MGLLYEDLSYEVLGVLFETFNEIGPSHRESVYQKAISVLLSHRKLDYREQFRIPIVIKGIEVGVHQVDFEIAGKILLEIKSRTHFRAVDFRQTIGYLKVSGYKLAILAMFTTGGVKFRRVLNVY